MLPAADRELGVARQRGCLEAEALHMVDDGLGSHMPHHAHRDDVAGPVQRFAQAHGTVAELAAVVARPIDGLQVGVVEDEWRVPKTPMPA